MNENEKIETAIEAVEDTELENVTDCAFDAKSGMVGFALGCIATGGLLIAARIVKNKVIPVIQRKLAARKAKKEATETADCDDGDVKVRE